MIAQKIKKFIPRSVKDSVSKKILIKPNQNLAKNLLDSFIYPIKSKMFSLKLNSLIKGGGVYKNDPYKSFCGIRDDFWFYIISNKDTRLENVIPKMPLETIQLQFTGVSGNQTLMQAFLFYELIKKVARSNGINFNKDTRVLDFGCGWGRILRFFTKDVHHENLFGTDVDKEVLEICENLNFNCNFYLNDAFPPTEFDDNFFDVIYAYSVYSHLSEDAHLKWLLEFKRILKPGGILIVTSRGREFIINCEESRQNPNLPFYAKELVNCFNDYEKCLLEYDEGKFMFEPVGGGGVREDSFYGESCIPEKYVLNNWSKIFKKLEYIYFKDHKRFDQNVIIAIK